jgi:hypothetical protein
MRFAPARSGRVLAATLLISFLGACADDPESFAAKREWSVLQGIEFDQRSRLLSKPTLRTIDEFEVLGLPGRYGQNVWILLRPASTPYYKQMPANVDYAISRSLIDSLSKDHRLSPTVEAVFQSHTTPPWVLTRESSPNNSLERPR